MKPFIITRPTVYRVICCLVLLFSAWYLYISFNPPFQIMVVEEQNNVFHALHVSIQNRGISNLTLRSALVDGKPSFIATGVGVRPKPDCEHRAKLLRWRWWTDFVHHVEPTAVKGSIIKREPVLYGFTLYNFEPVGSVTIRYRYLGIPFSYTFKQKYFTEGPY